MRIIFVIFPAILISHGFCNSCKEKILFSSKTPYKLVAQHYTTTTYPDQCQPIHINMIHRHGNRYPSAKDVKNMDTVIDKINAALKDYKFKKAKIPKVFSTRTDKLLSHVGEKELYHLAKRIRMRFPSLFTESYSPLLYSFNSSCKLRCSHSSNSLAAGLFEGNGVLGSCGFQPIAINMKACEEDPILRFFDICEKYNVEVAENKTAFKEYDLFTNGPEMKSAIKNVKKRIKLPSLDIDATDVHSLFLLCAYEIGMFNGSLGKGICSFFDTEDRRVLEYRYDMKSYIKRSGAYEISYKISCELLKDIYVTLINAKESNDNAKQGVFRSAHSETILPLFTLLGLFDLNQKFRHDNFEEMKNRSFKGGCYGPFSGNLYFVLYKCKNKSHKVQMYVNERLTKIPCCNDSVSCDFDVFLKCYKNIVDTCDLESMCKVAKHVKF